MPITNLRKSDLTLAKIHIILVIGAVVAVLVLAREICIPIALAALLTFLLAPLVTRLERWCGRVASVLSILAALSLCTAVIGYLLALQVLDLANNIPDYHANIQKKVSSFQAATSGRYDRFTRAIEAIRHDLPGAPARQVAPVTRTSGDNQTVTVTVQDPTPDAADRAQGVVGPILDGFGLAALVLLLTVFMLLHREDLRGRIIRLAAHGRISLATVAMADAGARVFRYLMMQVLINLSFGVLVAIGLFAIGVPNALLWGAMAFALRFIPYVGPWIAALLPTVLAVAVSPDWTIPLLTVGLFATLELVTNNVIEPWLYRSSTGISSLALILAAVVWGWLWGPIGLILATPLTVCLVVIGRHVPRLAFLSVLLSDEEPLAPHQECYHRMLRDDISEATTLVDRYLKTHPLPALYDDVLIPVLLAAEADHAVDDLDREHRASLHQGVRDLLDDLASHHLVAMPPAGAPATTPEGGTSDDSPQVLCLPARALRDELAAVMLSHVLRGRQVTAEEIGAQATASGLVDQVVQRRPAAVCISVVAPSAMVHARGLCLRLRARLPTLKLVVGFWGMHEGLATLQQGFHGMHGVEVVTTLEAAADILAPAPAPKTTAASDACASPTLAASKALAAAG